MTMICTDAKDEPDGTRYSEWRADDVYVARLWCQRGGNTYGHARRLIGPQRSEVIALGSPPDGACSASPGDESEAMARFVIALLEGPEGP